MAKVTANPKKTTEIKQGDIVKLGSDFHAIVVEKRITKYDTGVSFAMYDVVVLETGKTTSVEPSHLERIDYEITLSNN